MNNQREYLHAGSGAFGVTVGAGGGATFATEQAPPQPFTDVLGAKLSILIDVVNDTHNVLAETGDRLFGSLPRGISGESAAKPNGGAAEILARLDAAISTARSDLEEARRLQSGI